MADFRVKYRFYTPEEGGRKTLPFQGYRSDYWYPLSTHSEYRAFIIHPEFEDEKGEVITDLNQSVAQSGTAAMQIINPDMKPYHKGKIQVGMIGYFMEGDRKVAICEVIEVNL